MNANSSLVGAVALLWLGAAALAFGQGTIDYPAAMTGAKIHYKGSRWNKAAALFRTAINLKPASAEAQYWLGLSLSQIGKESLLTAAEEICHTS